MTLLTQASYKPLTETTAANLAVELGIFPESSFLTCKEIGDGNLNLVFRIVEADCGKSIIIKQALPYAKVVGESWPLTLERARIEADALKVFNQLAPEFVPAVHYSDEKLAITVMDDLSHLKIARTGFIEGQSYPLLSKHLGEYAAKTLFFTSDFGVDAQQKKEWQKKFINPELCKITEDLIFTDPFYDAETNSFEDALQEDVSRLWNDEELKLQVALLKKSFLTEGEALLHGDLHTGSVFADEFETKVIDPEFAFYGPAGFDLGQVIANVLFQAIRRSGAEEFLHHVEAFYSTFEEEFTHLWRTENKQQGFHSELLLSAVLEKYFSDAIGFAGCELIRRTIGLAHVADLDSIENDEERILAKKRTLDIGKSLILLRKQLKTTAELLDEVKTKLA